MLLLELEQSDLETAVYDPDRDSINKRIPTDTRKTKLTLRHLNRLKKLRALDHLDKIKRNSLLGIMYGIPDGGDANGGAPF